MTINVLLVDEHRPCRTWDCSGLHAHAIKSAHFIFEGLQAVRAYKLQSLSEIDIVWVEEAQSVSKVSLNTLIPTIRKNGSRLWFAWNPHSPKDAVDAMFRGTDIASQEVPDNLKDFYDVWAVVRPVTQDDNDSSPHQAR